MRLTDEMRFEAVVARISPSPSGCWLWTGTQNGGGRGKLYVNNRYLYAYRVAYELFIGPIPAGLVLDHLCRQPLCVNPTHLEPVTQTENAHRAATGCRKGHGPIPEGHRQCPICSREWARRTLGFKPRFADGLGYRTSDDLCRWGHELTPENTYTDPKGYISCRTCFRISNRVATAKYKAKLRARRLAEKGRAA